MNAQKRLSPAAHRAQQLLLGGLSGGHVGALLCVMGLTIYAGTPGLVSSLFTALAVVVFFTIGQGVQIIVADASPKIVMITSLASYAGRVSALGVGLELVLSADWNTDLMNPVAVIVTTVGVVFSWLYSEFFVFRRLRIPVFDSTENLNSE